MSSQVVLDAFSAFLGTQFPQLPLLDVTNETPDYPVDTYQRPLPFMALFGAGSEEHAGIGDPHHPCWRETGSVNIAIYYPSGLGSRAPRELADQIRGLLRGRALPTAQRHVHVQNVSPIAPFVDSQNTAIGSYYVAGASAAYQYDSR
jgi:hypothetical protein